MISKVIKDEKVNVYISAVREKNFEGIIKRVSPTPDEDTKTYPVEIEIDNLDGLIKSGMFAEVEMVLKESDKNIVISRKNLELEDGNWFAYIVEDEVVKKIPVKIGIDNGEELEIRSGLKENDKVITKGREYVTEGEKVNIIE